MNTEEHINNVLAQCSETLNKEDLNSTDEETMLETIRLNLSLLESRKERKTFMREVVNNIQDLVLIKKYKLIYKQVVHEDRQYFNSTGFLKRVNDTFYVLN